MSWDKMLALVIAIWAAFCVYCMSRPIEQTEVVPEPAPAAQPMQIRTVQEVVETPAADYASVEQLELVGTFTATAYCPCVKCCGIWSAEHPDRGPDYVQRTSSGTIPAEGRTIAADWSVLPAGTEVVILGHTYTVEDTGGCVNGNRVDIFFEDHKEALEWGVQQVNVYEETGVR